MQISELPQANSFSNSDVIAIEISGVTYKLTGATLAAALKSLGSYVTGVKGNSESSYRTGQVNITPANIGAVSTANVANNLTTTDSGKVLDARQGKTLNDKITALGSPITVDKGGTGATAAATARTNLGAATVGEPITLTGSSIAITNTSGSIQIMTETSQGFNQYKFVDLYFSVQGKFIECKRIWTRSGSNTSFSFGMTMNHTDDGVRDLVVQFVTDGRYIKEVVVKLRNNSGSGQYATSDTWLRLVGAYGYKD